MLEEPVVHFNAINSPGDMLLTFPTKISFYVPSILPCGMQS